MATLEFLSNEGLNINQEHTIDFDTLNDQNTFWASKVIAVTETYFTISRLLEDSPLSVGKAKADLMGINYCRVLQDGKYYYFFIVNKRYVNDSNTALTLKLDVLQTFLFDFEIAESFVEREHQNRIYVEDNEVYPKFNRESENIEKGSEFVLNKDVVLDDNIPETLSPTVLVGTRMFWVTIVTKEPLSSESSVLATNKAMPTNVYVYVAPVFNQYNQTQPIIISLANRDEIANSRVAISINDLYDLSEDPKVLSINISYYAPFKYGAVDRTSQSGTYVVYPDVVELGIPRQFKVVSLTNDIRYNALFQVENYYEDLASDYAFDPELKPTGILSPVNLKDIKWETKLLTAEYQPMLLQYGGNKMNLDRSDFDPDNAGIRNIPTFSVRNTSTLVPAKYKGEDQNFSYAIKLDSANNEFTLRKDAWLTYLSSNKNSLTTGLKTTAITGALGVGASLLTGGPFGFVNAIQTGVSTINKIAGTVAQIHDLKETPDEISKPSLDIIEDYVNEGGKIHIKFLQIRDEFMQKCFEYFYRYGYACRQFKVPDLKSRYYFNFIRIIDANIKSNIDNEYIEQLKNIFEKGITFWHHDRPIWRGIGNYDYENSEMHIEGVE